MLNKFSHLLGLLLILASLGLVGCGSDSDGNNDSVNAGPDPDDTAVDGAAVKGPLVGADVNVYLLDPSQPDLKGRLIGSGSTDDEARISGVDINIRRLDRAFLLEISGGTDLTTGEAPLISPLRTIISADALNNGQPVYATPLTTFILAYAQQIADADGSGEISIEELIGSEEGGDFGAVEAASAYVQSVFGFGVLDGSFDLFLTAPIFDGNSDQADSLAYRMASEAFAALVVALEQQGSASAAEVLQGLAEDISDGVIDGMVSGVPVPALADISDVQDLVTQNPAGLTIPGTSLSLADLLALLAEEAADLSPGVDPEPLPIPVLVAAIPGDDSDGDGVIDANDACPDDPAETLDSDGDGFCDGDDLFPNDGNDWADSDNDSVGDNADQCDSDSGTSFNYGFENNDGDALCALVNGDVYARNQGIDYNDNNGAVDDICDAGSGATLLEQGDAGCFADDDNDTIPNPLDNCPNDANLDQANLDNDAFGDVCDSDRDGDGVDNGSDAFPDDGSGWLDCGDGFPATSCDTTYTFFEFLGENTQAAEAPFSLPSGEPYGDLISSDGNILTGQVTLGSAVPSPSGTAYFVLFDYRANWTINISAQTLTVNSFSYCNDLQTDPLGINPGFVGGVFPVCAGATWPNFIDDGVVLDSEVTVTDDGSVVEVVFTTGDGTENVFTFRFSY